MLPQIIREEVEAALKDRARTKEAVMALLTSR
jgi:hypothetical protein